MSGIWETPLYHVTLGKRTVTVNVTRSCPSFEVPTPGVADVADDLRKAGMLRILDFGAGKLRNSLYLLKKNCGFDVWAVEFSECFATVAGQDRLAQAEKHKKFFLLEFPNAFLHSDVEVDAVFLINVANVVPSESHRRLIIKECTKR